jgi:pSer/pThr/pTyr-binding forkhead associated (FHA) protein
MVRGPSPARERGAAYLTVIIANKEVQRKPITGLNAIVIGRSLDCDLWIDDPMLSRRHCQLEPALEGDGWVVTDLDSRNGTHVNGKHIVERTPLNHRDVITIGKVHIKFHAHGYVPPRPTDPNQAMLLPARTKAAMTGRAPTPHHSGRTLPTPTPKTSSPADSTITHSSAETIAGDRTLPFTRPPAKPIVRRREDDDEEIGGSGGGRS